MATDCSKAKALIGIPRHFIHKGGCDLLSFFEAGSNLQFYGAFIDKSNIHS